MSDLPQRIQLSRRKGWRLPPGAIKVDRSTRWGNPWRIGEPDIPDAAEAVRRFRCAVAGVELGGKRCPPRAAPGSYIGAIIADIEQLRGKSLACWCPIGAPCHADVLMELANG